MNRYSTFFAYVIELASRYQQGIAIGDIMTRASADKNLSHGDFGKLLKISLEFQEFQEFKKEASDWE